MRDNIFSSNECVQIDVQPLAKHAYLNYLANNVESNCFENPRSSQGFE
jgi:hypothetical protein